MFVPLCSPLRGIRGRFKSDNYTWFRRNDRQFLRRYSPPADPKSASQVILRQRFFDAKKNWARNLSEPQRQAWKRWALEHTEPNGIDNIADYNAFVSVELNRMALGLAPGTAPPQSGVPERVLELEQLPAEEPNTFRFRLWHGHSNIEGARVLVETTPATLRPTRAPREGDLRRAAGVHAESFLELKPSGDTYELRNGLHMVEPGERFGMRMRIISSEIVAGAPVQVDWIRLEFHEDEWSGADLRSANENLLLNSVVRSIETQISNSGHADQRSAPRKGLQAKRSRELDRIQKEQIEAYWSMLERMYSAPWRPPWMEKR